jgi:hypothetical protein
MKENKLIINKNCKKSNLVKNQTFHGSCIHVNEAKKLCKFIDKTC